MEDHGIIKVLLTGFGPFGEHKTNPSWEIVKAVYQELEKQPMDGVFLKIDEIPVVYDFVEHSVPELWKEFQPNLVVHCGVSHLAEGLVLEQRARRYGYCRPDVNEQFPKNNRCCQENIKNLDDELFCDLDLSKVADEINKNKSVIPLSLSSDAGLYLCEFIYYRSLACVSLSSHCVFVHVPILKEPMFSLKNVASSLRLVLEALVRQVRKH